MGTHGPSYGTRDVFGGYPQHLPTDFKPLIYDTKLPISHPENPPQPPPRPPKIPHDGSQATITPYSPSTDPSPPPIGAHTASATTTPPYHYQQHLPYDEPESPPPPLPTRPTPPVDTGPTTSPHVIYSSHQHGFQAPSLFSPVASSAMLPYPSQPAQSMAASSTHGPLPSSITPPHPFSPSHVPYPPHPVSVPMTPQYSNGPPPPHTAEGFASPLSPPTSVVMLNSFSHPGSPSGGHPPPDFGMPDMSGLSLHQQPPSATIQQIPGPPMPTNPQFPAQMEVHSQATENAPRMRIRHDAKCAGCGCFPIRGDYRWHCLTCPNENLCPHCKEAGVKSSHKFKPVPMWTEVHPHHYCWGCKADPIVGVRSRCKTHYGEDWCEECVRGGRSCKGPFVEYAASELGIYLEQYGGVPMPKEWLAYLPGPPVETYTVHLDKNQDDWLALEGKRKFVRKAERELAAANKTAPLSTYSVDPAFDKHTFSDSKYRFTFRGPAEAGTGDELDRKAKLWDYAIRWSATGWVLREEFAPHFSDQCIPGGAPTFRHGPECDSLVFTSPPDHPRPGTRSREFRWLTNRPVSALNADRWDAQLYALFERVDPAGGGGGGGERIVADMAWWDGQADQPKPVVHIRDPSVDHGLVLATLTVLHAHQWRLMAKERELCPEDFKRAEKVARTTFLGRSAYWKHDDNKLGPGGIRKNAAGEKDSMVKRATLMNLAGLEVAANVLEIANKLAD